MKVGSLVLRLAVGGLFVGHGLQKLRGSFDGPGLDGTEQMMKSLELHPARRNAVAAAVTETAGGAALALGLATPVALIRVEEVRVSAEQVDNAIQLPLLTCMYLGDRWECLFTQGDTSLRAYSKCKLAPGSYWLQMPREKLWVF